VAVLPADEVYRHLIRLGSFVVLGSPSREVVCVFC